MTDTNKSKVDHIPLCMIISLPKVEVKELEGKKHSVRDMSLSFQAEDWRAQWFDHHYARQVDEMDFKEALQEQGDVYFAYNQFERVMQELATDLWPVMKKTEQKDKEGETRCQTLKLKWWIE